MSAPETYNGWKNYPTWAVHLWLTNDESSYLGALEMVGAIVEMGYEQQRYRVADALKNEVRSNYEPEDASMAADLVGWAFDCVDWYEIADGFIEMCEEIPA